MNIVDIVITIGAGVATNFIYDQLKELPPRLKNRKSKAIAILGVIVITLLLLFFLHKPCDSGVLCDIFPDNYGAEIFTWAIPDHSVNTSYTSGCAHSGSIGILLEPNFKNKAGGGGWAVHWNLSPSRSINLEKLNVSKLVFWAKGERGDETFQVGMKDSASREWKLESSTLVPNIDDWKMITVPLTRFSGIDTTRVENTSFGVAGNDGAGRICIDDIAFH